jgi:hypothetical protein
VVFEDFLSRASSAKTCRRGPVFQVKRLSLPKNVPSGCTLVGRHVRARGETRKRVPPPLTAGLWPDVSQLPAFRWKAAGDFSEVTLWRQTLSREDAANDGGGPN